MTQLTIYFKNKSTAGLIEKLCEKLPGIYMLEHDEYDTQGNKTDKSYAKILGDKRLVKHRTGLDEAIEDIKAGRIERFTSLEDLLKILDA